jgi:hypothetical protein
MARRDPELERRWRSTMVEWERSGETIRAVCRKRRISEHTFHSWRRELKARDAVAAAARAARSNGNEDGVDWPRFVQLEVTGSPMLELCVGDAIVLRVPATVDGARLAEILGAAMTATTSC